MRYAAGFLYALALASHCAQILDAAAVAVCVFAGTVAFGFAIEGIVRHEVHRGLKGKI